MILTPYDWLNKFYNLYMTAKPEPIMLLVLSIIPSKTSQNFWLFLIYSYAFTLILYYSLILLCQ